MADGSANHNANFHVFNTASWELILRFIIWNTAFIWQFKLTQDSPANVIFSCNVDMSSVCQSCFLPMLDRTVVVVIDSNDWRVFTGNEMGCLLIWWMIHVYKSKDDGPGKA